MDEKKTTINTNIETFGSLNIDGTNYITRLSTMFLSRKPYQPPNPDIIRAFIPGTIIEVAVTEGQEVYDNDHLLTVRAMKMNVKIKSPEDGIIKKVFVTPGQKLAKGDPMIEMEPAELY